MEYDEVEQASGRTVRQAATNIVGNNDKAWETPTRQQQNEDDKGEKSWNLLCWMTEPLSVKCGVSTLQHL